MKLIDKINKVLEEDKNKSDSAKKLKEEEGVEKTWYSYEYFPPKTAAGKLVAHVDDSRRGKLDR